ncbi:hypothetical protein GIB67_010459 [Kingdonia uniflora]|uniref:Protein kinase domain-containing protein n=1 Tax=Kingdonia uniflora TaxID=39325 RepID=A0A7J7MAH3_9MAGN|nr:hypothetical protein GIB67_010459 [Kingdonia uniflora]
MSAAPQRVVVIQDASREVSSSAIAWAQNGLMLKSGDRLILLGVLHQVNNPSTLSFMGAGKLLGYKSRMDSSMFGSNPKMIEEEVARKKEEYHNNEELIKISKQYKEQKIEFKIVVKAGSSPKITAIQASKYLKATWVILDRQMKKDKRYFMEKLSCGISRMKRDNSIEQLRGARAPGINKMLNDGNRSSNVTYDEMLPGTPDDEELFSLELSPIISDSMGSSKTTLFEEQGVDSIDTRNNHRKGTSFSKSTSSEHLLFTKAVSISSSSFSEENHSPLNYQEKENIISTPAEKEEVGPSYFVSNSPEEFNEIGALDQGQNTMKLGLGGFLMEEAFENSICSECKNRRPMIGLKKDFTYAELQAATDGFSSKNFLSEGGFGSVYKGKLRDGVKIAVKQHKAASFQGEKEFESEVHVLSKARHRNVVMLLGSYSEGSHRLLVYEYVCNGSLDQHLSQKSRNTLSWTDRVRIALGAAKGLNYLHKNNIVHRDMRPNNILVTHDYEPLLGDFGLARTQHEESDNSSDTRVVGTFGYLAPEYAESGKVSTKTDVYSFGVVLLELITGRRTIDKRLGEKSLVGWARPLLKEKKYPELLDPKLIDSHDVHQLYWMVQVAEKCLSKDPEKRQTMEKVVQKLTYITDGQIGCGIIDFSPAHSDSVSSIPDSTGSQGDEETTEMESLSTDATSMSNISRKSVMFSSESSASTISARSSSTSTRYERSILSGGKNNNRGRVKSRSRTQFTYGEMLH